MYHRLQYCCFLFAIKKTSVRENRETCGMALACVSRANIARTNLIIFFYLKQQNDREPWASAATTSTRLYGVESFDLWYLKRRNYC